MVGANLTQLPETLGPHGPVLMTCFPYRAAVGAATVDTKRPEEPRNEDVCAQ